MITPCFALIDVNAFYCSAEILFQPWLRHKPVVVASNNDGCVVSRNDAAKAMGIKMGQPVFELTPLVRRQQLHVFSSNYPLYQVLSNRIMAIISEQSSDSFVYSIDESFSDLSGMADPEGWGRNTQALIDQRVGMPVGVGIGPTKTLAKLANWAAKKWKAQTGCVVSLMDIQRREKLMRIAPVEEVWGIGSRTRDKLSSLGIHTAWDLSVADAKQLRRLMSVNVERTARELAGIPCFALHEDTDKKKMIACTRSFGSKLHTFDQLRQAVASYVATASAKLRGQESVCSRVEVFARTSGFIDESQRYGHAVTVQMPHPTADSRIILSCALEGLRQIYREGYAYAKAGVILMDIGDEDGQTLDLFAQGDDQQSERLMGVLDAINARMGRGTLKMGIEAGIQKGSMCQGHLSPGYMTHWDQLARVKV